MSEHEIQNAIMEWLHQHGIYAVRVNSGRAIVKGKGRMYAIAGAPAGTPDIIACVSGVFVGIEVKTETGKMSPEQHEAARNIESAGGRCYTVRSLDDVKRITGYIYECENAQTNHSLDGGTVVNATEDVK